MRSSKIVEAVVVDPVNLIYRAPEGAGRPYQVLDGHVWLDPALGHYIMARDDSFRLAQKPVSEVQVIVDDGPMAPEDADYLARMGLEPGDIVIHQYEDGPDGKPKKIRTVIIPVSGAPTVRPAT